MTGCFHALQWQAVLQRLIVVSQVLVVEGQDIHWVLDLCLFWEYPLQCCARNSCMRFSIQEGNSTSHFSLRERNTDDKWPCKTSMNALSG
ncbi:hypothetical protein P692DRAFT_20564004 [Suillus brevipes Sb2]|nr:hypothetical protein P692DRAFT_20564004 [Suillus brevipes Sb2]